MNERLDIYRESFHLKLDLEIRFFPLTSSENQFWSIFYHARSAWCILRAHVRGENAWFGLLRHAWGAWTMLREHVSAVLCINACFFALLGVCFHIRCLGTWEHNFFLCNVF